MLFRDFFGRSVVECPSNVRDMVLGTYNFASELHFLYYNHMEQALECDVAGHVTHVFIQIYRSIEEKR